jgi:FlaG/FlaF family flagellin (archaellin)
MPIFVEKHDKLNLNVSDTSNLVKITVDCDDGTLTSVAFDSGNLETVHCGETVIVGKAKDLKGKTIEFNGLASNPSGDSINVKHTIFEEGSNKIIYVFPDNFSGVPKYSGQPDPSYTFYVNFI